MATARGFEGWTNFETWAVNHWLTSEEADYDYLMDLINDPDLDRHQKAAALKATVADMNPLIDSPSLWGDLLDSALQSVDWSQIVLNHLRH